MVDRHLAVGMYVRLSFLYSAECYPCFFHSGLDRGVCTCFGGLRTHSRGLVSMVHNRHLAVGMCVRLAFLYSTECCPVSMVHRYLAVGMYVWLTFLFFC